MFIVKLYTSENYFWSINKKKKEKKYIKKIDANITILWNFKLADE